MPFPFSACFRFSSMEINRKKKKRTKKTEIYHDSVNSLSFYFPFCPSIFQLSERTANSHKLTKNRI
ncbi:Uncharacterized protein TCM_007236 [Theobroma cacao]|uniref:Uncharacterized protein n=1 Tax=Theobroma cacao TaxID=3641 RepID=A0A061E2B1_THECC|nr:Uncharacterized protein TCM_007236 [Theobroma cacao]